MKIFIDLKKKMTEIIGELPNEIIKITVTYGSEEDVNNSFKNEYFFKKEDVFVNDNDHLTGGLLLHCEGGEMIEHENPQWFTWDIVEIFTDQNLDITSITQKEFDDYVASLDK